jgi:hypothetical protein
MEYNDLIVKISEIPLSEEGISDNLARLMKHAKYLEGRKDVDDPHIRGLLDVVPSYIRKMLERLQLHLNDEADIVAWISRNLMELHFMLNYAYSSCERYDELIKEQLKDLNEIEKIICPEGTPSNNVQDKVKTFHSDMEKFWECIRQYGVERNELKSPKPAFKFAEGAGLEDEYRRLWKIHSKYVHPTSYLLFGKKSFVYGGEARQLFWLSAQYYAARNLRDFHRMIEVAPKAASCT